MGMKQLIRKTKPELFQAWRVDVPKTPKESKVDWDEAPLLFLIGFVLLSLAALVLSAIGIGIAALILQFGWWSVLAPPLLAAFVYLCYRIGRLMCP